MAGVVLIRTNGDDVQCRQSLVIYKFASISAGLNLKNLFLIYIWDDCLDYWSLRGWTVQLGRYQDNRFRSAIYGRIKLLKATRCHDKAPLWIRFVARPTIVLQGKGPDGIKPHSGQKWNGGWILIIQHRPFMLQVWDNTDRDLITIWCWQYG